MKLHRSLTNTLEKGIVSGDKTRICTTCKFRDDTTNEKETDAEFLFQSLEDEIPKVPDNRSVHHTIHKLRDAIFVVFSSFFLQSRSLKGHINFLNNTKAKKNKKSIFSIETVGKLHEEFS